MTPEERKQQVREAIAEVARAVIREYGELQGFRLTVDESVEEILNLKYESGAPMLAVLDENQPKNVWVRFTVYPPTADMPDEYALVPADLAGWRKMIT